MKNGVYLKKKKGLLKFNIDKKCEYVKMSCIFYNLVCCF